jgi:N-acetylglucosaminyl-diphospho-decaprenol L-rhamnosyltransferase
MASAALCDPARATYVVLNWRQPELTVRAAEALLAAGAPAERVVVVDNGSADGSAAQLTARLPECAHVALEENGGFARGNNAGAATLAGDAYVFVNSDAFAAPGATLAALLAPLAEERIGLTVPLLRNEDGSVQSSVFPLTRPGVALVRASGLSRFVPDAQQPRWSTHWSHDRSRDVECAVGAVVAVRADAWEELGGWPERSFMYGEDVDLFWRARELGWRARFVREAVFTHLGNASASARWDDAARAERVGRAEREVIRLHSSRAASAAALAALTGGLAARRAWFRLRGNEEAAAALDGALRGYRGR